MSAIMGFVSGLLGLLSKLVSPILAIMYAKNKAKADTLEQANEKKDKYLEIASRPTLSRDALLERMRGRKSE